MFNPRKFKELCGDETPMIRRAVAAGLGTLSQKMKSDMFIQEMLPFIKNLVNDDQDSVRILSIDSIIVICKTFTKDLNKANIVPILIHMIRDKAWKVRIKMADSYQKLADAMGQDITDNSLLNIFSSLLEDPEGEVRTAGAQNFASFLKLVTPAKYQSVLGLVLGLTSDTLIQVRVAAFEILSVMALGLPKEEVRNKVLDMILVQFKKENSHEVKIEQVKSLKSCGIALGTDFYSKITNNDVNTLLKESNWRVRKEVYTLLVEVAVSIGSSQLFEVHFQEFFLTYLKDKASQVRIHGNSLLKVALILTSDYSRSSQQVGRQ